MGITPKQVGTPKANEPHPSSFRFVCWNMGRERPREGLACYGELPSSNITRAPGSPIVIVSKGLETPIRHG